MIHSQTIPSWDHRNLSQEAPASPTPTKDEAKREKGVDTAVAPLTVHEHLENAGHQSCSIDRIHLYAPWRESKYFPSGQCRDFSDPSCFVLMGQLRGLFQRRFMPRWPGDGLYVILLIFESTAPNE